MFSTLKKNNLFYILDKSGGTSLKVANVETVGIIKYTNSTNPTVDITVKAGEETLNFNELPAMQTMATKDNVTVSESREEMLKEVENSIAESKKVLESVAYHENMIKSLSNILPILNPALMERQEQERKITALEEKLSQIELGVSSMKDMMSQMMNKINS